MSKNLKYTVTGNEYSDIYAEKYNKYTVIALTVGQQTSDVININNTAF